jgi:hypothetical protein
LWLQENQLQTTKLIFFTFKFFSLFPNKYLKQKVLQVTKIFCQGSVEEHQFKKIFFHVVGSNPPKVMVVKGYPSTFCLF